MTTRKAFSMAMICMMMILSIRLGVQAQEPQTGAQEGRELKLKMQLDAQDAEKVFVMKTGMAQYIEVGSGDVEYRFGGKPIKGAPFSAQVIIENTQTLANGVRISHNASGMLYRDNEGRTRREQPRDGTPEIVMIDDPVAGAFYRLHMIDHTVSKLTIKQFTADLIDKKTKEEIARTKLDAAKLDAVKEEAARKASSNDAPKVVTWTTESNGQIITENIVGLKAELLEKQRAEDKMLGRERKTESLGTQMFDGVEAEGTRTTITIPAGKEGNDRPFEIVSEKWYSQALQVVVMTKHSDPRVGDNVYRLANISLGEPSRSLFTVPSDFTEEKGERRKQE